MPRYYVWSGSLRGEGVEAQDARHAVDQAVRNNLPCVLGESIRVSLQKAGLHPLDIYFQHTQTPYTDMFPDLFDGSIDVEIAVVERP